MNSKKYGIRGFEFTAVQIWNDLTDDVKQAENYVFKKKLSCF